MWECIDFWFEIFFAAVLQSLTLPIVALVLLFVGCLSLSNKTEEERWRKRAHRHRRATSNDQKTFRALRRQIKPPTADGAHRWLVYHFIVTTASKQYSREWRIEIRANLRVLGGDFPYLSFNDYWSLPCASRRKFLEMPPIENDGGKTELKTRIQELIDSNQVMVFSKSYCPYCLQVRCSSWVEAGYLACASGKLPYTSAK